MFEIIRFLFIYFSSIPVCAFVLYVYTKNVSLLLLHTQENLSEILLNQTEIRLYLPFSDLLGAANGHCPFAVPNESVHGKYNLILV